MRSSVPRTDDIKVGMFGHNALHHLYKNHHRVNHGRREQSNRVTAICNGYGCGTNKEISNENLTFNFSACNPITVEITLHGQDDHDQSENCVKLYQKKARNALYLQR